jgi:hypothetical protein
MDENSSCKENRGGQPVLLLSHLEKMKNGKNKCFTPFQKKWICVSIIIFNYGYFL